MSKYRILAIDKSLSNSNYKKFEITQNLLDYYNEDVFDLTKMKDYISEEAYDNIIKTRKNKGNIDRNHVNNIAKGMRQWAKEKGARYYTHWFQPLTKSSAEKHDSFFDLSSDGKAIEKLSADSLVQQEPDASSFPSGGIRNTFEARGYTAWDVSSNVFIVDETLCIPTVFISYTGESLDYKAPLLKSIKAIDVEATKVVRDFFDKNVENVTPTLGTEQEFFLIDLALYESRPDLVLTGRSLLGHKVAKGQQLDDHYFGVIPDRVMNFLNELEYKAMKVGIPIKTRHNEAAPSQFELAPLFEEANIAVDHNILLMNIMKRLSIKHNLKVLFHEKPFDGINGSGKHSNWSLSTDSGQNLLAPGDTPENNLVFLTFFINIIKSVKDNADLLRAIVASAGNDYRLGANEAPPAIMSIFIGKYLTKILEKIEKLSDEKIHSIEDFKINVVDKIPEIFLDNTDRNRTSPFAFTGNKFEFRAVGSSDNCSMAITVLNTILANQLKIFHKNVDELLKKGETKDNAIMSVLREYIKKSKVILFEGDGYSRDWEEEAEKRGLNNVKDTSYALDFLKQEKFIKLFEDTEVLSKRELEARREIFLENYIMKLQIESRVLGDISGNHVIPTAIEYQNIIINNVRGLKDIFGKEYQSLSEEQMNLLKLISRHIKEIKLSIDEMVDERKIANGMQNVEERAKYYTKIKHDFFNKIRYHCDKLEIMVSDEKWPLTKYRELLFSLQ